MDQLTAYSCSTVPHGHQTGLAWRRTSVLGTLVTGRATSTVERVLRPYEVCHLPVPGKS